MKRGKHDHPIGALAADGHLMAKPIKTLVVQSIKLTQGQLGGRHSNHRGRTDLSGSRK